MGKPTKRTKKFITTKLDSHIKNRKEQQKKKKLALVNAERRAKSVKSKLNAQRPGRGDVDELGTDEDADGLSDGDDAELLEESDDGRQDTKGKKKLTDMSVDEFLQRGLDGVSSDEDDEDDEDAEDDEDLDELEDESDEEGDHAADLSALAKKDPAFYKYLQENDADLLNFDADAADEDDAEEDSDAEMGSEAGTAASGSGARRERALEKRVVTLAMLRGWQRSILQQRSLRALRRLLLAFRAAAQLGASTSSAPLPAAGSKAGDESAKEMSKRKRKALQRQRRAEQQADADGAEGGAGGYVVQDARVYQKVIQTTLKYMPLVLEHHVPYKTMRAGGSGSRAGQGTVRYKMPTNDKKYALLQRPIQSFFHNLSVLLRSLPDGRKRTSDLEDADADSDSEDGAAAKKDSTAGLLNFVVEESSRMIPYIVGNQRRKMARDYIKIMLELWSTAADNVRISAFLAVRKMAASAGSESDMLDMCLKGTYHAFVRSTKLTTAHTLPSINLMKNSASQLFLLDLGASYQQAFGFIRQLAIHLRNCLQNKSKDAYQNVYNWQYVHCLDFWSLVLSATCDKDQHEQGAPSPMEPLIYPLVQVSLGAIRLIPTSRYFPLRLHVVRSLLRLVQRTGTYIPLAPYLVEMLDAPEFQRKPKGSTLKPLDLATNFRAPAAYLRTGVYADQIGEEVAYLLHEFLASQARSLAFPELSIPVTVQVRRLSKTFASNAPGSKIKGKGKTDVALKNLLDKVAQQAAWTEKRRQAIDYAPAATVAASAAGAGAGKQRGAAATAAASARAMPTVIADDKTDAPLEAALRLARKVRTQKQELLAQSKIQVDG